MLLVIGIIAVIIVSGCVSETGKVTDKPVKQTEDCTPNIQCGSWSLCSGGVQTRTCTDINKCNVVEDTYTESQGCLDTSTPVKEPSQSQTECVPSYKCDNEWSDCIESGIRIKRCIDENKCGKDYIAEGYGKSLIDESCQYNSSWNFCQKDKKTITEKCEYKISIGDMVTVENIKYTVTDAFTLPYVGTGYYGKEADGIFVVITLSMENVGKESEYISSSQFGLIDNQDRKYDVSTEAIIYLGSMGFDALIFDKLGPGLKTEGSIIFDVPSDDKGLKLKISGGLFKGSKTVEIGDVSSLG